jgi:Tfp pilus assembly protein PilO
MQKYIEDWPITAERELREAEQNLEDFLAKIPDKEDIPGVLRKIQEYGVENSQLELKNIENITKQEEKSEESATKNEEEKEGEKYAKGTYKLVANGNYFDVMKFLYNLETMERLINIEGFDLRKSSDTDSIDLDLTFNIFYSKPEEESTFR